MLKLFGLGLIMMAGMVTGQLCFMQLESRYRDLESVRSGLRALISEIEYTRKPLPDAWRELAEMHGGAVARIFGRAAELFGSEGAYTAGAAWVESLRQCSGELSLTAEDLRILASLGPCLGTSGGADQIRHLQAADERLSDQMNEAREDSRRRGKLFRSLGLLGGILVAVVLA
ncbi:MAG: stage III sporulation protein AB [Bacillota bacterium]